MKYKKDLLFRLILLKRYNFSVKKHRLNRKVEKFCMEKISEKGRNIEAYNEIMDYISQKDIDKDRFYYICWEMGECLFRDERYGEASGYFKAAIDNVISESYKKNRFKFKSKYYSLLLERYCTAVKCLIKAGQFDDADYYWNLNIYSKNYPKYGNRRRGDLYASLGAKNQAIKYYEKKIDELDKTVITQQYDYDPYVNGYLEEEYKRKVKENNDEINHLWKTIKSLE